MRPEADRLFVPLGMPSVLIVPGGLILVEAELVEIRPLRRGRPTAPGAPLDPDVLPAHALPMLERWVPLKRGDAGA